MAQSSAERGTLRAGCALDDVCAAMFGDDAARIETI
jgi:hypothetical protein